MDQITDQARAADLTARPGTPNAELSPGAAEMRARILSKLTYEVSKSEATASPRDWFVATATAVRDPIIDRWLATGKRGRHATGAKRVSYMSLEFLIGRLLSDGMINVGVTAEVREALEALGTDLETVRAQEPDAALGNGGLGRLAACYIESMASVGVPATGYGIRYEHGLFRQTIGAGFWQREIPEDWLAWGNPWEFRRPELTFQVGFGGAVTLEQVDGGTRSSWKPAEFVSALAYDTPIVGAGGHTVNTLRLWSARASNPLKLEAFNKGDHVGALEERVRTEAISRVLYPSDDSAAGLELRLRQEFFFVSASLQDMIRRHLRQSPDLTNFDAENAIQLNDTHPAIGVAELMRLLVDEYGMAWDAAWKVTSGTFHYTNHTLLPEALEMWSVPLMERLLPRHMQIIYLINNAHLDRAKSVAGATDAFLASVSLIDESHGRRVRMGHLAFVGSRRINGVSALHSDLMARTIFHNLDQVHPKRLANVTNGITFRRWLGTANAPLADLIREAIGVDPVAEPNELHRLAAFATDASFQDKFRAARRARKQVLANVITRELGFTPDLDAMFDIQVKRIHEYKRQLLNILQTIAAYGRIRAHPTEDHVPRVKIFAGKAAPSYLRAKQIIQLAHDVARVINNDPSVRGLLKVAFLPNYNVTLAEKIMPAADLSEQISTAGMEASGTGNMKFALNGALTIGTLDGANVEIRDHVGPENIFIFGLTVDQVERRVRHGLDATARAAIAASPVLEDVLDAVRSGVFSPEEPGRYRELIDELVSNDRFLVTADFDLYCAGQDEVDLVWKNPSEWWARAIRNTASMGWFSSDRSIRDYARDIWGITPQA